MFHRITLITLILIAIALIFKVSPYSYRITGINLSQQGSIEYKMETKVKPFKKLKEQWYFKPVRLYADSVNLDVKLVEVGVEDGGFLEAPKDWSTGGWFSEGTKAGQRGNVIVDGHYDNNFGMPAAFWELKNLKVSDKVFLQDELGRVFGYEITDIFHVDVFDPERTKIFDESESPTLTLVTCGGVWIPEELTYSKRLVVKGKLVS